MTDIYRQELDIPEKSKTFGWFLLALGAILLIMAAIFFYDETRLIEKYAPPEAPRVTSQSARAAAVNPAEVNRAKHYLELVIVAFALLMVFVVAVTLSHRIALHLRSGSVKPLPKTKFSDPWQEAGRRFPVPPKE